MKIILSICMAIYYVGYILYQNKKYNDKSIIKNLSIYLFIAYIIYLVLIRIIV